MVELAKPRIEYLSYSMGKYIDIEEMNQRHLINAIRKMVMNTRGSEFRLVYPDYAEKAFVTSTITEVEIVTE